MTKTNFAFLDALTRIAELKIEQLFNVIGVREGLTMTLEELKNKAVHPCFDFEARHRYARVHLPVAKGCNIQCKFCNRKFGCLNENRPGVSAEVLSPGQALAYFDMLAERLPNITVAGIAGPGEAFATPDETLETLRLIRTKYPDMLFCIATNGFNAMPYIDILKEYGVTHMTVTINAVNPDIGEKIYSWAREGTKIYRGKEAAEILMERQLGTVEKMSKAGMFVKVNTVLIPGINDNHAVEVAEKVSKFGANIFNAMPLYPVAGTQFSGMEPPSEEDVSAIRKECGKHVLQMVHCQRCRADAAGLLNEPMSNELKDCLSNSAALPLNPDENRAYVAVASTDGVFINQHLGAVRNIRIYKKTQQNFELVEERAVPQSGGGDARWEEMAKILKDCKAVVVSGIGRKPRGALLKHGISVYEEQSLLEQALDKVFNGNGSGSTQATPNVFETYLSTESCGGGKGCAKKCGQ